MEVNKKHLSKTRKKKKGGRGRKKNAKAGRDGSSIPKCPIAVPCTDKTAPIPTTPAPNNSNLTESQRSAAFREMYARTLSSTCREGGQGQVERNGSD